MENCVAPGLDKFRSIIRSCIVFGQTTVQYEFSYVYSGHSKFRTDQYHLLLTNIDIYGDTHDMPWTNQRTAIFFQFFTDVTTVWWPLKHKPWV